MYSFVLVLLLIAITFLINIYPRRLQEPMGPTLNKISYLVLTNILIILLGSLLVIFFNLFYTSDYLLCLLVPIKIYDNFFSEKARILKENAGLSGVYLLRNKKNGSRYIGSGKNLKIRISKYYHINRSNDISNMIIYRSLLK
jgi:hypothetical protein